MSIQTLPSAAIAAATIQNNQLSAPYRSNRQTVLSGPVDSSGLPTFGGSTGSTTVTATGTLVATATAGSVDYTGTITNPSWTSVVTSAVVTTPVASPGIVNWTGHPLQVGEPVVFSGGTLPTGITAGTTYYVIAAGLTANAFEIATAAGGTAINFTGSSSGTQTCAAQTSYLYLDIASDGTVTTGSTPHAPAYQWGGTYSTVNNQHTYNIQETTTKVGNGSTSTQVNRVFVGQVAILTALVNSITWYALMCRYDSGWTSTLPAGSTSVSKTHNIGIAEVTGQLFLKCLTADNGYTVGDVIVAPHGNNTSVSSTIKTTRLTCGFATSNSASPWFQVPSGGGAGVALTGANWAYKVITYRPW